MAADEPDRAPLTEDARLAELDARLERVEAQEAERTAVEGSDLNDEGYRQGNRVLSGLIGGMVGGAVLGWLVDRLFDTAPWGLLSLLALGTVAAFRNVFRMASGRRP